MSADTFLQHLTQVLFVLIFILVAAKTYAQPRQSNVDATLLFGAVAVIVVESWVVAIAGITVGNLLSALLASLLMALPYLLLRLVDDFAGVPRKLMRLAELGLALSVLALVIWTARGNQAPGVVTFLLVAYFAVLSLYDAFRFVGAAADAAGVTRRRLRAIALGSLSLGLALVVIGIEALFPHSPRWFWGVVGDVLALVSGVSYFAGFAPPAWLRRSWQEPELRAFLGGAASLPRLPTTTAIVRELERGTAESLGTDQAVIGLWDEEAGDLRFDAVDATARERLPLASTLAGRAFLEQRPIFSDNMTRDNPVAADFYGAAHVRSMLAVPITTGARRLGVLAAYASRGPIFAEDDLSLTQLLADQAAVILESRSLIDEAARVQAREEATRLKDDFLSAAAHDLKTPLTALIAQAQLLELRARRDPGAPADVRGISRIGQESRRLNRLVTDLLDLGRVEGDKLLQRREEVDLVALARDACARHASALHECTIVAEGELSGHYDPVRIAQLLDNLLENAVKYSPEGGDVRIDVRREGENAYLAVSDSGIGIPAGDVSLLFERFHRGSNVDDRRFAGMGLGLFICRGIVEQHGGRLWASSPGPDKGSTFHVLLPLAPVGYDPASPVELDAVPAATLSAPGESA